MAGAGNIVREKFTAPCQPRAQFISPSFIQPRLKLFARDSPFKDNYRSLFFRIFNMQYMLYSFRAIVD